MHIVNDEDYSLQQIRHGGRTFHCPERVIYLFPRVHCVPVHYASIYHVEVGAVFLEIMQARRVGVVVLAVARVDPQVVYSYNALA